MLMGQTVTPWGVNGGEIRVGRGEGEDLKSQPSTLQIRFIMVLFMVSAISLKFSSDLRIILLRIYSNAVDTYHTLTSQVKDQVEEGCK